MPISYGLVISRLLVLQVHFASVPGFCTLKARTPLLRSASTELIWCTEWSPCCSCTVIQLGTVDLPPKLPRHVASALTFHHVGTQSGSTDPTCLFSHAHASLGSWEASLLTGKKARDIFRTNFTKLFDFTFGDGMVRLWQTVIQKEAKILSVSEAVKLFSLTSG